MATTEYKAALLNEIEQLKKENAGLTQHVRPQTLEAMKTKTPEEILKRVSFRFFAKRILILTAAIGIAIAATFVAVSFIKEMSVPFAEDDSMNDPNFTPDITEDFNEVGSSTTVSHITEQGGICYASKNGCIYKYVGNEWQEITSASAEHLNAYKYRLYYYDTEDRTVYRIRTDGQEKTALMINIDAKDIKVYNNTVYVLTDSGDIHSVYINGKKGYPVIEGKNIISFTAIDGHIYYICREKAGNVLYRIKASENDPVIVSTTDSSAIAAIKDHVFYIHDGTLYGLNTKEEKAHAFFAGNVKEFSIINDNIFVLANDDLYVSDLTGSNIEKLQDKVLSLNDLSFSDIIISTEERQGER